MKKMKTRNLPFYFLAGAMLAAVVLPSIANGQATSLKDIKIPALPRFDPQEPKRIELPNGMVVLLQPDHELPLISGFARLRGGARSEPEGKTGLVNVYGEVWRTGGTEKRTGEQLDDFLEDRAAGVETGGGIDSTSISFDCLKQDFEPVFAAFLELLKQPAFRSDKIELAKRQIYTGISRRNDSIGGIASREAMRLAYGRENPYARVVEYATVAAITRQDLVDWHRRYVHPNNMILGIEGDFDPAQMEATLRQAFETWPKADVPPEPEIQFRDTQPGNFFIAKDDVNQTSIHLVGTGILRKNPDYFAVEVMNEIFGGGFSSRLFTNLRSRLGLAYSVGGGISAGWDHPGVLNIGMATKSESTRESIEALYKELDKLLTEPITEEELKRAKDGILNSFIFNFDSKGKVLQERMRYEFYGFPAGYLEQYRAGVDKVTSADVKRVAMKYVHPKQLALLVVGNPEPVVNELKPLGTVQNIDIAIPPPPGTTAKPSASRSGHAEAAPARK